MCSWHTSVCNTIHWKEILDVNVKRRERSWTLNFFSTAVVQTSNEFHHRHTKLLPLDIHYFYVCIATLTLIWTTAHKRFSCSVSDHSYGSDQWSSLLRQCCIFPLFFCQAPTTTGPKLFAAMSHWVPKCTHQLTPCSHSIYAYIYIYT